MLKWMLFETWAGDRLLAAFEALTGLCIVELATLATDAEVMT